MIKLAHKRNLSLKLRRVGLAFILVVALPTLASLKAQVPPRSGVVEQREVEKPRITIRNFSHGPLVLDSGLGKPPTHRFFDRKNLIGFSAMFAARSLDVHSTCRFLRRGYREAVFPSQRCGTIAAGAFSASGMVVGVSYWFHRKGHHKLERWLPRIAAISGGIAATWNYSIP